MTALRICLRSLSQAQSAQTTFCCQRGHPSAACSLQDSSPLMCAVQCVQYNVCSVLLKLIYKFTLPSKKTVSGYHPCSA